MKHLSLKEKLGNTDYVDGLSDRRKRELEICGKVLNKDELESESSIQTGYRKARKRFIKEVLSQVNPELSERALHDKVPIFNMGKLIEEYL